MGAGLAFSQPSTAVTANGASPVLDSSLWRAARIDLNVSAFTGGTAPTVTFSLVNIGQDGIAYPIWTSAAIAAAASVSVDLADSLAATYVAGTTTMQHAVFGMKTQLQWSFAGAPTSITFSANLYGRQ
jgi:hypothetical protein